MPVGRSIASWSLYAPEVYLTSDRRHPFGGRVELFHLLWPILACLAILF